jgi:NitT/TauT family transport system substrate-binding protein
MMRSIVPKYLAMILVISFAILILNSSDALAQSKKFKVAWSIYAGWQPWDYANQSGILKKWADKNNIEIELVRMDYIPSVEAYVAKKVDACVMTNMEALDMPAASGITTTVVIMGDFSNGNDAILTREGMDIKGLAGEDIYLVELSVSHYLLARALEMNGMQESDVTQRISKSSGYVESPGDADTSGAGHQQDCRFLADPRRDPGSHGCSD